MRIRNKISVPFVLLVFAGISLTALLSMNLVTRVLEQRFERQLVVASAMLSQSNFVRNPMVLEQLKAIIEADLLTVDDGLPVASTLGASAEQEWLDLLQRQPPAPGAEPALRRVDLGERHYTIAYRALFSDSGAMVVILKDTSDIVHAGQAITRPIVAVGIAMALLTSLISHLVTRNITAPLQELAAASQKLAAGDWNAMVEAGSNDELGELATALNEMARELRRSEEKLLRSEKLLVTEHLAARVAHDIRNPLFSIKMRAQMMRERLPAESLVRDSLGSVLEDIEQVEWVVQGLLDLASPVQLRLEEASVNAVVGDVLASTAEHLAHVHIEVERALDPGLPEVMLDPGRLKQALLNLVLNAAEAMPEGGILGANTRLDDASGAVIIEIRDIGEGIDPADAEKLFDPFFTTKREGVGLGLVNARSLVEAHGGSLELRPRDGRGTRAVVRLPAAADRPATGEA